MLVHAGRVPATWRMDVSRTAPKIASLTAAGLAAFLAAAPLPTSPAMAQAAAPPNPPSVATILPKGRMTVFDLKLGTAVADMPKWLEFKGYACGSNGGPPQR